MPTPVSLSSRTAAPTGFQAVRETLSNLLLLLVIAMITTWAERLIASLRQRTETTDLTDITRDFGTTDIALIIERLTTGLQRLRELEDKVRRAVAGLDPDPQLESASAPSSPLSLCASQPLGLTPEDMSVLSLLAPKLMAIAPVRATGPPNPRLCPQNPTGPVHPLIPRGMDGPAVPIPPRRIPPSWPATVPATRSDTLQRLMAGTCLAITQQQRSGKRGAGISRISTCGPNLMATTKIPSELERS